MLSLEGKVAIITGGSQGLGFEIARHFVEAGASVVICARHAIQLQESVAQLSQLNPAKSRVYGKVTDVSDPQQVKVLVDFTLEQFSQIDVLVACAGIYGTKGAIEDVDWAEWSHAIDINLKGAVLSARQVLPYMKKAGRGKIVFLSGGGATKPLPGLSAYAASKAALVRFSETLAEETKSAGIDVNAVAPGALNTRMLEEILTAGPEKVGEKYYEQCVRQKEGGGTPPSLGAELCVFLASSESDGITGRLISAVWDPWKRLPEYINDIRHSDIYTLRRIVPADRDLAWGEAP